MVYIPGFRGDLCVSHVQDHRVSVPTRTAVNVEGASSVTGEILGSLLSICDPSAMRPGPERKRYVVVEPVLEPVKVISSPKTYVPFADGDVDMVTVAGAAGCA